MTGEFFATWDDLNIKVNEETGKPDTVNIIPMYRVVKDPEDSTANKWIRPLFADVTRLHCYCSFNENGYISSNVASSEWGNAANGISRSDGWEFSTEQENTVTSNKGHSQAIFLSDACSDKYIFSVDMKIVQGLKGIDGSDGIFRGGICAMSEGENDFAAVLIEGTDLKDNFFKITNNFNFFISLSPAFPPSGYKTLRFWDKIPQSDHRSYLYPQQEEEFSYHSAFAYWQ